MRIFISGGCKNGKSTHAQTLALRNAERPLYYIATMEPRDEEDEQRVERHKRERSGMGFTTVELPRGIDRLTGICDINGSFLLDSLTALLSNEMFLGDTVDYGAVERVFLGLESVLCQTPNIVIVSDFIYSDANVFDGLTERYRRGLARLDALCANRCDIVLEACCGMFFPHKGGELYETVV